MKVFISWSGERSQALAAALREWLPLVLHYALPWLSQSDIDAGERWGIEVAKELDSSSFGITCITAENVNSPWLLFEAGALAKSLDEGRVVPLLFEMDFQDISGPLAQFQAKKVDRKGVLEIVTSINKAASDPIPDARLAQLFGALWPQLEAAISEVPKVPSSGKKTRSQSDILEDLVGTVRNLDARIRDEEESPSSRRGKRDRYRVMMMEEVAERIASETDVSVSILVAASIIREVYPWVYELSAEASRAIKQGDMARVAQIRRILETSMDGPRSMGEEYDYRAFHLLMREYSRAMHHLTIANKARSERAKKATEKLEVARKVAE